MTSRRSFLRQSAAAIALSQLPSSIGASPKDGPKLGVALVGLGGYSRNILGPALRKTRHCQLTGIVTGSPEKAPIWRKEYGIDANNVYSYDTMHEAANNPAIDVFYIVVPTALHAKYAIIAAKAAVG